MSLNLVLGGIGMIGGLIGGNSAAKQSARNAALAQHNANIASDQRRVQAHYDKWRILREKTIQNHVYDIKEAAVERNFMRSMENIKADYDEAVGDASFAHEQRLARIGFAHKQKMVRARAADRKETQNRLKKIGSGGGDVLSNSAINSLTNSIRLEEALAYEAFEHEEELSFRERDHQIGKASRASAINERRLMENFIVMKRNMAWEKQISNQTADINAQVALWQGYENANHIARGGQMQAYQHMGNAKSIWGNTIASTFNQGAQLYTGYTDFRNAQAPTVTPSTGTTYV